MSASAADVRADAVRVASRDDDDAWSAVPEVSAGGRARGEPRCVNRGRDRRGVGGGRADLPAHRRRRGAGPRFPAIYHSLARDLSALERSLNAKVASF